MKTIRIMLSLSVCLTCVPLYAGLQNPGCDGIEKWSMGYDSRDQWQVTPYVRFPGIARDETLVPLFGQSVLTWSKNDFRDFSQWVSLCRREAAKQRKPAVVQSLNQTRRAMLNLPRYVQQMQSSRDSVEHAVREMSSAPNSAAKKKAIHLAERALHGRYNRRDLNGVPRQVQLHIQTIANARRYLPKKQLDQYAAQLAAQYESIAVNTKSRKTSNAASKNTSVLPEQKIVLIPPTLEAGADVRHTRLEGISIGMSVKMAIAILEKKGYQVKRHAIDLRRLTMVKQYPVDTVSMSIGKIEPFPGGKMTREEANAYKTRVAIGALKTKNAYIEGFKGRVVNISVNGSSFEDVDTLKAHVYKLLGKPHKESGAHNAFWNLRYYQDKKKQKQSDTQLQIEFRSTVYSDSMKHKNRPYTSIKYTVLLCLEYPSCR